MTNWVNFAEVRAKVSLEEVIFKLYGVDTLSRHGDKLVGPCPVHGGDSPRAFHADLERNIWHCFSGCKRGGNQLDFVAVKEGVSVREAALKLQARFLVDAQGQDPEQARSPRPEAQSPQAGSPTGTPTCANGDGDAPAKARSHPVPADVGGNPPLSVELKLAHDHPHLMQDRGLKLSTCENFGVGYCRRGIMRGCITFPLHDEHGTLVAYAGRRLKPQEIREYGKYKLPKGFKKDLVLYNFHTAKAGASEHGLILVEGAFSVLKLFEAGFENVVAAMGCDVSAHQVELLSQAKEVIILFDGNEAGRSGAEAVKAKLKDRIPVRVAHLPDDTEPDDLSPRALRWLVKGMQALDLGEVKFWVRVKPPKAGD